MVDEVSDENWEVPMGKALAPACPIALALLALVTVRIVFFPVMFVAVVSEVIVPPFDVRLTVDVPVVRTPIWALLEIEICVAEMVILFACKPDWIATVCTPVELMSPESDIAALPALVLNVRAWPVLTPGTMPSPLASAATRLLRATRPSRCWSFWFR